LSNNFAYLYFKGVKSARFGIMIKTITIDIINDKALKLIKDLELLQLIRVRSEDTQYGPYQIQRYKGAMSKQPVDDIDQQLNDLRNGWE